MLNITRKGRWQVIDNEGNIVSEHNTEIEACENATNWSFSNGGKRTSLNPPAYEVVLDGIESPRDEPEPIPTPDPEPELNPDPEPSPEPDPIFDNGFTSIDISDAVLLDESATLSDIQNALNENDKVGIKAGTRYEGGLIYNRSDTVLFAHGSGPRPVFTIRSGHAMNNGTQKINKFLIQGIEFRMPEEVEDKTSLVRLRLIAKDENRWAKNIRIEDCKFVGGDDGVQIVDDWPRRKKEEGIEHLGRIEKVVIHRCIFDGQFDALDSHSIPFYIEGAVDTETIECTFVDPGIAKGKTRGEVYDETNGKHPNKRAHCIYAQSLGGTTSSKGCWFISAAAHAAQYRHGYRYFNRNVISRCALGPWFTHKFGEIKENVILDQEDIRPITDAEIAEGETITSDSRGHGFMGGSNMYRNIAARRHGLMKYYPAFADTWGKVEENYAVQWADNQKNFGYEGGKYENIGTNKTIEKDPGLPEVDEATVNMLLSRQRNEWDASKHSTDPFYDKCWEIVINI